MCTANTENLKLIEATSVRRVVAQVWDPRSAAISAVEHADQAISFGHTLKELYLPSAWSVWPIESKIDWLFDLHFDSYVDFIRGWQRVQDDEPFGLRARIVNAERLSRGGPAFIDALTFLELYTSNDAANLETPVRETIEHAPGRRWQDLLTPSQKQSAADRMGDPLVAYFDDGVVSA